MVLFIVCRFLPPKGAKNDRQRMKHASQAKVLTSFSNDNGFAKAGVRRWTSKMEHAMQPESAETLLKRYAKRNFWLNVLDGVAFVFGISMVSK